MELGNSEIGNVEICEVQPCWSKTMYDCTLTIPGEYGGKKDGAKRFNFQKNSLLHHACDIMDLATWTSRALQCELNFHQAHKLGK